MTRMLVTVADGPTFKAADYGGISGGLANGLRLFVRDADGSISYEVTDPLCPVRRNVDWASYCFDSRLDDYGSGDNFLKIRWTFAAAGRPLFLSPEQTLTILGKDDFSDLADHFFVVQGCALPFATATLGEAVDDL